MSPQPRSDSIIPDLFAAIHRRQLLQHGGIGLRGNKPHRAIGQQGLSPSRMVRRQPARRMPRRVPFEIDAGRLGTDIHIARLGPDDLSTAGFDNEQRVARPIGDVLDGRPVRIRPRRARPHRHRVRRVPAALCVLRQFIGRTAVRSNFHTGNRVIRNSPGRTLRRQCRRRDALPFRARARGLHQDCRDSGAWVMLPR